MNEELALAQVRELDDVIAQLDTVRGEADGLRVDDYKDAGGALWAGQSRTSFTDALDAARSDHARISDQIGQAIGDCKSKQRALAFSINPLEHPVLSAQAVAIALN
ncbi:hypothetical protein [Rathayibacter iranicus]|nr:hypothetical protein [Rathayibacter iranicus]MWV32534.1 hypothetical protein [Rathayibacter iranicus NCPPB 2253 = VKM Ac-1602]PPI45431.1 hypothetical protein C5E09_10080 [Rathayibacter iranicus]PPI70429.1 hypothetical protein C5E01_10055 [Rathayibacter iranicus]PWJ57804.1 hypothetical protein B0H03_1413 [Rathayibacter iranicus NCPPB 2253 = VKM Ac-1602]